MIPILRRMQIICQLLKGLSNIYRGNPINEVIQFLHIRCLFQITHLILYKKNINNIYHYPFQALPKQSLILLQQSIEMEQKFKSLPEHIQKLCPTPVFQKPNFSTINSENSKNVSLSVKTNTLVSLTQPPQVHEPQPIVNNKPIILVFCQPSEEICIDQQDKIFPYSPISYANWLEGAGARCIPLPYNINEGSIQFLLERTHGLVIPGGGSNLYRNFFKKQGQGPVMIGFMKILRFIQKMWNKGVYYPIWGTCLGFQIMLIALTNDTKVLSNLNSRAHQLELYSDYQNSKFLKKMPLSLRLKAQNYKLINFQHSFGISVHKFVNYPKLQQKLRISQISKDKDGKWFCSGLQGKQNPIFLSQYHPQKQAYQWTKNGDIIHTQDSIQISQYLVTSFVEQCRKCKAVKQFGNSREQSFYLIQNYRQIHTPQKMYKVYAIDFKYREYDKETRKQMKSDRSISTSHNSKSVVKKPFI